MYIYLYIDQTKSRQTKLLVTSCVSKLNVTEHRRGNEKTWDNPETQDVDKQIKKNTPLYENKHK